MGASTLFCETTNVLLKENKEIKMVILRQFQDQQNARKICLLFIQFQYIKKYLILFKISHIFRQIFKHLFIYVILVNVPNDSSMH